MTERNSLYARAIEPSCGFICENATVGAIAEPSCSWKSRHQYMSSDPPVSSLGISLIPAPAFEAHQQRARHRAARRLAAGGWVRKTRQVLAWILDPCQGCSRHWLPIAWVLKPKSKRGFDPQTIYLLSIQMFPSVYALKLEDGCYYVGLSTAGTGVEQRLTRPLMNIGANWPQLHKPIPLSETTRTLRRKASCTPPGNAALPQWYPRPPWPP
eukprot:COSAG01_NODE_196_length_22350_cov_812.929136_13_plen_212_part_00